VSLQPIRACRYVTPLREGGSLPGLMEADDLGSYVVKFRGAGQGPRALVAEVISGELGRALGLPVPELRLVHVDPVLADAEPDQEVQDLLRASGGLNLGVDFLPGALDFTATAFPIDPLLAGQTLWFDALIGNVDRSWRNPNLLYWHRKPYLIDHGAALTFHHTWRTDQRADTASASRGYDASEHALAGLGADVDAADALLAGRLGLDLLRQVVAQVPDEWLLDPPAAEPGEPAGPSAARAAYVRWLSARLDARERWLPGLRAAATAATPTPAPAAASASRGSGGRPSWLVHGDRPADDATGRGAS
jgi:hypothetical protein